MLKVILLSLALVSQALAADNGPIVWGNNNNALYRPTNRPSTGYQCLAIDHAGNITPQACSGGGGGGGASPQTYANISSNQTLSAAVQNYYVNVTGGSVSVNLPSASANPGVLIEVMNNSFGSVNLVTVVGTINGTANEILGAGENSVYKSNGTEWKKKN